MHSRSLGSEPVRFRERTRLHQRSPVRRLLPFLLIAALVGCESEPKGPVLSRTPVSIRGWLVAPPSVQPQILHLTDTASGEAAYRARLFEQTRLSVEGFPFASGGMAGNGSFIILDVPPGGAIINFQPSGGEDARLVLEGMPPNADILLPGLEIRGTEVVPTDPSKVVVRVPGRVQTRRPIDVKVTVAGRPVPVFEVPLSEMIDRREFPDLR